MISQDVRAQDPNIKHVCKTEIIVDVCGKPLPGPKSFNGLENSPLGVYLGAIRRRSPMALPLVSHLEKRPTVRTSL